MNAGLVTRVKCRYVTKDDNVELGPIRGAINDEKILHFFYRLVEQSLTAVSEQTVNANDCKKVSSCQLLY